MQTLKKHKALLLCFVSLFFMAGMCEKDPYVDNVLVQSINLDYSHAGLGVGDELTLTATITPSDATTKSLNWRSHNENVAIVDVIDGNMAVVTAVSPGTAIITATAQDDSGVTATCVITVNKTTQPYEKLQGRWKMNSVNNNGASQSWNINIVGAEEGEDGYNEVFQVTGIMGYDWTSMTMFYNYDEATKTGYVYIPAGNVLAEGVNFGLGGTNDVVTGLVNEEGNLTLNGGLMGTWNDDFTEITFEENKLMYGAIFSGENFTGYTWFNFLNPTMTK